MEEKHRFISLAGTGRFTLTELCADFHVSRKTVVSIRKTYPMQAYKII